MVNHHFRRLLGALVILAVAMPGRHGADEIEAKCKSAAHATANWPTHGSEDHADHLGPQAELSREATDDYRAGDRANPIMRMAKLSRRKSFVRRAYFASKAWRRILPRCRAADGMAVCQICHQEQVVGGAPAPGWRAKLRVPDQADERLCRRTRTNSMDMAKIMSELGRQRRQWRVI